MQDPQNGIPPTTKTKNASEKPLWADNSTPNPTRRNCRATTERCLEEFSFKMDEQQRQDARERLRCENK